MVLLLPRQWRPKQRTVSGGDPHPQPRHGQIRTLKFRPAHEHRSHQTETKLSSSNNPAAHTPTNPHTHTHASIPNHSRRPPSSPSGCQVRRHNAAAVPTHPRDRTTETACAQTCQQLLSTRLSVAKFRLSPNADRAAAPPTAVVVRTHPPSLTPPPLCVLQPRFGCERAYEFQHDSPMSLSLPDLWKPSSSLLHISCVPTVLVTVDVRSLCAGLLALYVCLSHEQTLSLWPCPVVPTT